MKRQKKRRINDNYVITLISKRKNVRHMVTEKNTYFIADITTSRWTNHKIRGIVRGVFQSVKEISFLNQWVWYFGIKSKLYRSYHSTSKNNWLHYHLRKNSYDWIAGNESFPCVCLYIYIYIYIYTQRNIRSRTNTHIYIYIHKKIYTRTQTYIYIYTQKYTLAHKHIYVYMHTHTHTHTYIYIYIYIHSKQNLEKRNATGLDDILPEI